MNSFWTLLGTATYLSAHQPESSVLLYRTDDPHSALVLGTQTPPAGTTRYQVRYAAGHASATSTYTLWYCQMPHHDDQVLFQHYWQTLHGLPQLMGTPATAEALIVGTDFRHPRNWLLIWRHHEPQWSWQNAPTALQDFIQRSIHSTAGFFTRDYQDARQFNPPASSR